MDARLPLWSGSGQWRCVLLLHVAAGALTLARGYVRSGRQVQRVVLGPEQTITVRARAWPASPASHDADQKV